MIVKRVYYRNNPIMLGAPPLKPPASYLPMPLGAATLWEQLEKAGIPEVKGVWGFVYGGQPGPFTVIAIKQRYAGHSKQALLVAAGARAGAYGGKFVVVVDDDIDIANPADVIWAIATRCHVREGHRRCQRRLGLRLRTCFAAGRALAARLHLGPRSDRRLPALQMDGSVSGGQRLHQRIQR